MSIEPIHVSVTADAEVIPAGHAQHDNTEETDQ